MMVRGSDPGQIPLLIVDGYNMLRSSGAYDSIEVDDFTDDPLNEARERLISDIATYALSKFEAIIVFDGGGNLSSRGEPVSVAGIKVIFSASGTDADATIEKLAFEAKRGDREVVVVSSDSAVQNATFGGGVTRMSSTGLMQEISDIMEECAEASENHGKMTLAGRLDPETRAILEAMARGE